jgi:hypothetical protein
LAASDNKEPQPFDALDHDWALRCRQHRRSRTVAAWARTEPTLASLRRLADVIPATGVDRTPIAAAITRLHIAGDDLAGRALLQLIVPGLIRLTALWRTRLPGGVREAGWETITRASLYIAWLRQRDIHCAPAGYILRSVHRDLTLDAQTEHHGTAGRVDLTPGIEAHHGHRLVVGSAEDAFCGDTVVRLALEDATRAGIIPPDTLEPVWLTLTGQSVPDAFRGTRYSLPTAYRHRAHAFAYLHQQLFADQADAEGGR